MTPPPVASEAMSYSAVPRRVLSQHLRNLRLQSKLTVKMAASIMEWSEPKLWRIETGQTALRAMDVEAMCDVYGAPPDLIRGLAALARQTKAHGWWHSYGEGTPEHPNIYGTLEEAASRLLGYASAHVPTLLRTQAYARALLMSGPRTRDIDELVRECVFRQGLVIRANAPLSVTFVLSEAILRHRVGGPTVMSEQLRRLAEMAVLPNVCLRVVPFSVGMHPGLITGSFTLLQFPTSGGSESETSIVHSAGLTGELFLDRPHEILRYREAQATIHGCALDEAATRDLLLKTAKHL
jgi:hypothetical protein